jgi:hypothetical protein
MWPSKSIITEKNNKGLIRRGEIRLNSRCWHKPSDKSLQPLTPKARENPKHLLAHIFGVALRDTGPMLVLNHAGVLSANRRATGRWSATPPLKVEGLGTPNHPSSLTDLLGLATDGTQRSQAR